MKYLIIFATFFLLLFNGAQAQRVVVFGNSITVHPIKDYWWGEWGMAASTRENDFVHQLQRLIHENYNENGAVEGYNVASWERNFTTDKSVLFGSRLSQDVTHVILRFGENVPDDSLELLGEAFDDLIWYIKDRTSAPIYVTGTFWPHEAKESILRDASVRHFLDYISLSDLDSPDHEEKIGNYVYGDDGDWHEINQSGVANHPNDTGMKAIADRLYESLFISGGTSGMDGVDNASQKNQVEYGINGVIGWGKIRISNGEKMLLK